MILTLFLVFVAISLILIIIGLAKPSESAQAIFGFFFLFLLSLVIINGNLEYKSGETTTTNYYYNTTQLNQTIETTSYQYGSFVDETAGKGYGYWLALASAIGMAGVFFSLKNTKWGEE